MALAPSGWLPHLLPDAVKLIKFGKLIKEVAFKLLVRTIQARDRKRKLCNVLPIFPCQLVNLPLTRESIRAWVLPITSKRASVLMNILGPWAKASHGLALLCCVFDQPSFNLLSWV